MSCRVVTKFSLFHFCASVSPAATPLPLPGLKAPHKHFSLFGSRLGAAAPASPETPTSFHQFLSSITHCIPQEQSRCCQGASAHSLWHLNDVQKANPSLQSIAPSCFDPSAMGGSGTLEILSVAAPRQEQRQMEALCPPAKVALPLPGVLHPLEQAP